MLQGPQKMLAAPTLMKDEGYSRKRDKSIKPLEKEKPRTYIKL